MKIHRLQQHVTTKIGKIKAILTAACIRPGKIQYEISYFDSGEHKTAWLDECEFTIDDQSRKQASIGFNK